MTATIRPQEWLKYVDSEYLQSFIRDGGASVKFAVPLDEGLKQDVTASMRELAISSNYMVAEVSSATTRVHLIDQLFFKIAEQVPWRQLSEEVIVRLVGQSGYSMPPAPGDDPLYRRIAHANGADPEMLMIDARNRIGATVFREQLLAKDFRVAVTQLCLAELSGGPDGRTIIEVITDWFTGRNKAISAVRPYQIFTRIGRNNARHLLQSLLLWVRFAGRTGVILLLDLSRVTLPRNPQDGQLFYTKSAMFDAYEVLRQFIDATDRTTACLLVVLPHPDFLDLESSSRGIGAYDALKLRVYDEIRDERLVNPMGALVRLSQEESAI